VEVVVILVVHLVELVVVVLEVKMDRLIMLLLELQILAEAVVEAAVLLEDNMVVTVVQE